MFSSSILRQQMTFQGSTWDTETRPVPIAPMPETWHFGRPCRVGMQRWGIRTPWQLGLKSIQILFCTKHLEIHNIFGKFTVLTNTFWIGFHKQIHKSLWPMFVKPPSYQFGQKMISTPRSARSVASGSLAAPKRSLGLWRDKGMVRGCVPCRPYQVKIAGQWTAEKCS